MFNFSFRLQRRTRELCKSYSNDWLLVVIVLVAFSLIDQIEPFHRQFSVKDTTIQHPFAKQETVPNGLLLVLAFALPLTIIFLFSVFVRKSYSDLHNGFLGLFLAQALVLVVTDSVKIAVGRPRPDFLDRCLSLYDHMDHGTPLDLLKDPVNMLSNSSICTRTELLRDGFKSFPSGHSSFSFGGLGFLSMYIAGKLHLFDERGHIYKSFVVLTPLILAALIATSRVADYRHHWQDVTAGSLLGGIFAVFAYRQYYPSLASTKSELPFRSRLSEDFLPTTSLVDQDTPYRDDDDESVATAVQRGSRESGQGIGFGSFFRNDQVHSRTNGNGNSPRHEGGSAEGRLVNV